MKIFKCTVLLCIYFIAFKIYGQNYKTNDTLYIQNIEIKSTKVKADKKDFNLGSTSSTPKFSESNFSTFFSKKNNVFFKNYGISSSSTISNRGGNASQSLVLWNDLPITNAMLGLTDFSLIPLFLFDSVDFMNGSNTALYGSGALNASFNLKNETKTTHENSVEIFSQVGSFNLLSNGIKLKLGSTTFKSSTTFFKLYAHNNFPIRHKTLQFRQSHSLTNQHQLLQSFHLNPFKSKRLTADLNFWIQNVKRQIPPHLNQTLSLAEQEDYATRLNLNILYKLKNSRIKAKFAYFDEALNYYDALSSINSESKIKTIIYELNKTENFKFVDLLYGANFTGINVLSNQYADFEIENRNSIFLFLHKTFSKLSLNLNARQYIVNRKIDPLTVKLEGVYVFSANSKLHVSSEKVNRLPGLNDKYWAFGGQLDLKSETGFAHTLGYTHKKFFPYLKVEYQSNFFLNQIKNWIIWTQPLQQFNFEASNIPLVLSRGIEQKLVAEASAKALTIKASLNYNFTLSSYQELNEFSLPKYQVGDQLIYTPIHSAAFNLDISKKYFSLQSNMQYIGKTTGIQENLEAYALLNLSLKYQNKYKPLPCALFLNLNNILNKNYFIIENRPMPRFNFEIGFSTKFKNKSIK